MTIQMPAPVAAYFETSNADDIDALVACFATDASVSDEDQTHRGTDEIRAWAQDVRKRFRFTTEVLTATRSSGVAIVTGKLSGNFPGSPVDLDYKFTISNGKIDSLEIS